MSLTKDNSNIFKAPKKKGVLSEEAKVFKKTIEEVDKDLSKSSFGKLLVDVKSEQSLTEAQRKVLAKKKRELAKKKKEKEYMDFLEQAKRNLASSATNIDIVKEGDKKGEVQIDMDLEKLVNNESGEKVEMDNVFTPDVMGFSIQVTQQDEDGKDKLVLDQKVKRGVVKGNVVYYYLNKEGKKTPLDIPTKGKAVIKISPDELMNKSRSEVRELLKQEAIVRARKEAKKELSDISSSTLKVKEKPKSRKRRISADVAVDVLTDQSSSSSSSSSRSSSRSRSRRASRPRRSSRRAAFSTSSSERSSSRSHEYASSSSFEVTGNLSNEPIVSIPHKWVSKPKGVLRLRFSAMRAFKKAEAIAKKDGMELRVLSAYRDKAHQRVLWRRALKKYGSPEKARVWVAPPGGSNHQTGGTIDLNAVNIATGKKDAGYLKKILPVLGFENYRKEDWHWEFKSGRNTGGKNIYPKVMVLNDKDTIPYDTYLAKFEEENKQKEEQQMLASGKDVVVEDYVDPRIAKYVKEDLSKKIPGRYYVGNVPGNGDRVSIVYVPPGVKDIKKFVMHFHGTHSNKLAEGYVSGGVNVPRNRLEQTVAQVASAQNTMLVYPLSAGKKRGKKGYDYDFGWMDRSKTNGEDNADLLYGKSIALAKNKFNLSVDVNKIWVQGHSAGYTPIENICKSGSFVNRGDIELAFIEQDSTYGDTAKRAVAAAKKNGLNAHFYIGYVKGTKTQPGALAVKNKSNVDVIGNSRSKLRHGQYPTGFNFNTVESLV